MLSLHLYSGGSCSAGCPQSWSCCRHRVLPRRDEHSAKCSARHLLRMPRTVQSAQAGWEVWDDPDLLWASTSLLFIYLRLSSVNPWCLDLPVQAPTLDQIRTLRHVQSKHWFWRGLFFALDLFRGQRDTHILYFPGAGWWCQGLPSLLLLQLVNFAFDTHLPSFGSTEPCRGQSEEWYAVLGTAKILKSWCYIGIRTFPTCLQAERPCGLLWACRLWIKI